MKPRDLIALLLCLGLPLAVGAVSGVATASGIGGWYAGLEKPSFNPPNSVFGPVWTFLYLLMGISLFLVWRAPQGEARRRALLIFAAQLILNFAWSFLFFRFRQVGAALFDIVLLWVAVLAMILAFRKVRPSAAFLQVPYLAWVGFATALNAAIWRLN